MKKVLISTILALSVLNFNVLACIMPVGNTSNTSSINITVLENSGVTPFYSLPEH